MPALRIAQYSRIRQLLPRAGRIDLPRGPFGLERGEKALHRYGSSNRRRRVRQSERYAREGIDLSLSTLADQVGACATALRPLHALIEHHVLSAERLHGDDTTVPILAKGKTATGRAWVYVRDDRPFGGTSPPAVLFYASRDRSGDHPGRHLQQFTGILQADAYAGYNRLYLPDRKPGPMKEALCWAHARRKFFVLADIAVNARRGRNAMPISPIAFEAVRRIDLLFDVERDVTE